MAVIILLGGGAPSESIEMRTFGTNIVHPSYPLLDPWQAPDGVSGGCQMWWSHDQQHKILCETEYSKETKLLKQRFYASSINDTVI